MQGTASQTNALHNYACVCTSAVQNSHAVLPLSLAACVYQYQSCARFCNSEQIN